MTVSLEHRQVNSVTQTVTVAWGDHLSQRTETENEAQENSLESWVFILMGKDIFVFMYCQNSCDGTFISLNCFNFRLAMLFTGSHHTEKMQTITEKECIPSFTNILKVCKSYFLSLGSPCSKWNFKSQPSNSGEDRIPLIIYNTLKLQKSKQKAWLGGTWGLERSHCLLPNPYL